MGEKEEIKELIQRYNELKKSKGQKGLAEVSESDVRSDFIDVLFAILGWDIRNPDEYNRENYVRKVGYADVALKIDGKPVMFIEAKRFGGIPEVNRDTTDWIEEERQVMNYAASPERKIKWAVLTNFEKLRVFNALNGLLVLEIKAPWEYEERFEELKYLSKDSVKDGLLDRLETRRERPDIDENFLNSLDKWRVMLANEIYGKNKDNHVLKEGDKISLDKLKSAVQRILDRLIVVRYAEDRLILDNPDNLKSLYEGWLSTRPYSSLRNSLMDFFKGFDKIHNSKLFEEGHICEEVEIGSEVLGKIVEDLYDINFRKFDFDILGNTYETYLGHTLYSKEDGTLDLKPSQATRKKSGIYYTPPYVVDYIVKNTVGELLKRKKPDEVQKIKVLDPACGSGSFLIKAFDYFKDYYEKENEKRHKEIDEKIKEYMDEGKNSLHVFDNSGNEEIKGFEKKILNENLHGVDLDGQAAEIASVNLMLKALRKGEKLPLILGENIKVGNSLISGNEEELKEYFGDKWKQKKPFNWKDEFKDVFNPTLPEDQKGFDVVIGNPPYIRVQNLPEEDRKFFAKNFKSALGSYDIYVLFVEKAIGSLNEGGKFSFIMPLKFFQANYGRNLRKLIIENCNIDMIVDFGTTKVFGDATTYPCLLFLTKTEKRKKTLKYIRINRNASDLVEIAEKKLDKKSILNENYEIFDVTQDLLTEEPWNFLRKGEESIFKKLRENEKFLGGISHIFVGLQTSADPIYIVQKKSEEKDNYIVICRKTKKEYPIEKKICKPILMGKEIKRNTIEYENLLLIFPYRYMNGKMVVINEEEMKTGYPLVWDYLLDNKKILDMRENGAWVNRKNWHGYVYEKNLGIFEQVKMVTGVLAKRASFTLDKEGKYYFVGGGNAGGYGIVLNEEFGNSSEKYRFVLALLNSKLLDFYLQSISTKFQNDYYSYAKRFIEKLPIANTTESQQKELVTFADKMLSLNKQLNSINVDFGHYVDLHPRVKDITLGKYLENTGLSESDKEVLNNANRIEGKVREFEITEEGDYLVFNVGYEKKTRQGKVSKAKIRAFRCRIKDEKMRKFLYYSMKDFTTPGKIGEGNLYERILKIKIPCFHLNWEKNTSTINDIMQKYLPNVEKWEKLKKEIEETDKEIDQKVYELYGLTEEEIKIVGENISCP